MIKAIFDTLGFKEEEVKVYLALLEAGPQTVGDLAKMLHSPRPSIYGYIERLAASGLVTESMTRNIKIFAASSPARIKALYRTKIRDLRLKEQGLDQVIDELENRSGADLLQPRLANFEGRRALQGAMEEVLTVRPGTATFAFLPIRAVMEQVTPEFMRYHSKSRIKRDIPVQTLWLRSHGLDIRQHPYMAWGPEFKSELRYAAMNAELAMGYWVYGNKTLFISSKAEASGYTIESAEMAQMMRMQHAQAWRTSDPVPYDRSAANDFIGEVAAA